MGAGILLAVYEQEGQRAPRLVMGTGFGTESSRFDAAEAFPCGEKEPCIDGMYENMPSPPENVSGALKFNVILLALRLHMVGPCPVWYARDTHIAMHALDGLDFLYQSTICRFPCYNKSFKPFNERGGGMEGHSSEIALLAQEFEACRKILLAFGDENRQHLILEMMQMEHCGGARVGAITERTHLSRPAVSHHIRILKDAGILKMRREGTKNYYYFDADAEAMNRLLRMLEHAKAIMERLPDRSGET